MALNTVGIEFKGKKLLKSKAFRLAGQGDALPAQSRTELVAQFLAKGKREAAGEPVSYRREEFTAWGQTVLAFVREVYALSAQFGAKVFASFVAGDAPRPTGDFLRKDYSYLFERFYYYLEDVSSTEMGVVVFDELERFACRHLLEQMEAYFLGTYKGRLRELAHYPGAVLRSFRPDNGGADCRHRRLQPELGYATEPDDAANPFGDGAIRATGV